MTQADAAERYLDAAEQILRDIRATQLPALRQAAFGAFIWYGALAHPGRGDFSTPR